MEMRHQILCLNTGNWKAYGLTWKSYFLRCWKSRIAKKKENHLSEGLPWTVLFQNHQKKQNNSSKTTIGFIYFIWGSASLHTHWHQTLTQSHNEQGGDLLSALCACPSVKSMTLSRIHQWLLWFQPGSNHSSQKAAGIKRQRNTVVLSTASFYWYVASGEEENKYGNSFHRVYSLF